MVGCALRCVRGLPSSSAGSRADAARWPFLHVSLWGHAAAFAHGLLLPVGGAPTGHDAHPVEGAWRSLRDDEFEPVGSKPDALGALADRAEELVVREWIRGNSLDVLPVVLQRVLGVIDEE